MQMLAFDAQSKPKAHVNLKIYLGIRKYHTAEVIVVMQITSANWDR
jgi:hypothetical protein